MPTRTLKAFIFCILLLAASGLMLQSRSALTAGPPKGKPRVRGISIHHAPDGSVTIDISLTGPVPYRTMQLSRPDRLVVDLNAAQAADLQGEYPARSPLLKRVRTSQWKYFPAVFRVVADLKGSPAFSVKTRASGIRIELKPRGVHLASNHSVRTVPPDPPVDALKLERETAKDGLPPNKVFPVHRFKDLSASLTAPVLPPNDRLIPVAIPRLTNPVRNKASTLASVSGISIKPNEHGDTTISIASSRSVPYRVFQLAHPFRLVIDMKDARDTTGKGIYPVDSPVLKSVRVGQWRPDDPAVVRVVAELRGYPVFDVHAQWPGIRVELKPRQRRPEAVRNPFAFQKRSQSTPMNRPAPRPNEVLTAQTDSFAVAPGTSLSNLKVIGFIEKKDAGTQVVISDRGNVYLVPKGGTFENIFTVLVIAPNAVVVENKDTQEKRWIAYTP